MKECEGVRYEGGNTESVVELCTWMITRVWGFSAQFRSMDFVLRLLSRGHWTWLTLCVNVVNVCDLMELVSVLRLAISEVSQRNWQQHGWTAMLCYAGFSLVLIWRVYLKVNKMVFCTFVLRFDVNHEKEAKLAGSSCERAWAKGVWWCRNGSHKRLAEKKKRLDEKKKNFASAST